MKPVEVRPVRNISDLLLLLEVSSNIYKDRTSLGLPDDEYFKKLAEHCDEAIKLIHDGSIHRRRLPVTRRSITHKFKFGVDKESNEPHKGYITVGFFEDDDPGEIFISMKKTGSTVSGVLDCLAIVVSMALQHGVPLKTICSKLTHVRFEPDGFSGEEFGFAKSIVDYIFRWLEARYVVPDKLERQ